MLGAAIGDVFREVGDRFGRYEAPKPCASTVV